MVSVYSHDVEAVTITTETDGAYSAEDVNSAIMTFSASGVQQYVKEIQTQYLIPLGLRLTSVSIKVGE